MPSCQAAYIPHCTCMLLDKKAYKYDEGTCMPSCQAAETRNEDFTSNIIDVGDKVFSALF